MKSQLYRYGGITGDELLQLAMDLAMRSPEDFKATLDHAAMAGFRSCKSQVIFHSGNGRTEVVVDGTAAGEDAATVAFRIPVQPDAGYRADIEHGMKESGNG